VVAGKVETDRPDPQPVVAHDDLVAYSQLSILAETMGMDTTYEVSPASGFVRLNRDSLIVLAGHAIRRTYAKCWSRTLAFAKDDQGWHLIDHQTGTSTARRWTAARRATWPR